VSECASQHQHKENQMKATRKALAMMVLGSATLFGGLATTAAAEGDVYFNVRSSSHGQQSSSVAGHLTIDGRRFTIRSYGNIGRQIVSAFRRCGYDASCQNGKVIVCYDPYCPPRVRWQDRGYRGTILDCDGRLTLCWSKNYRSGYSSSRGYSNDGWYYRNDRHRRRPARRSRRWCD